MEQKYIDKLEAIVKECINKDFKQLNVASGITNVPSYLLSKETNEAKTMLYMAMKKEISENDEKIILSYINSHS